MNGQGWFGKIPSLGDFVTRRLPTRFVRPWDEWLSAELTQAQLALGDAWTTTYRQAPILCFSLGSGVIDENIWHGILVPSFDRVGREFPLTIADGRFPHETTMPARQWWADLITAGRRALEPDCGAEGLDRALAALGSRQSDPSRDSVAARMSVWSAGPGADSRQGVTATFEGLPRAVQFQELLQKIPIVVVAASKIPMQRPS
jgi:type VI secretion system ImpM family protein